MKRIANNVAVATILSTMSPQSCVKIVNVDHHMWSSSELWDDCNRSLGLVYTVDEILHKYENVEIAKAKVYRTAVNEGLILFVIDTTNEEY